MPRSLLRTISKEEGELFKTFYEGAGHDKNKLEEIAWNAFATFLAFAGPIFFLGLQFTSLATADQVSRAKSTGSLSPLPNISLFVNCVVWTVYGILKEDATIFVPNLIGVFTALYCTILFHRYSLIKPYKMYAAALVVCCGVVYLAFLDDDTEKIVGMVGCSMAVLFMGSPLAVMRSVIREKSTASLPFFTSLIIWLNALSWFLYGRLVADDELVWVPNALGLLLATVQLGLFAVYGFDVTVDDDGKTDKTAWMVHRSVSKPHLPK
jgi:solute carrier family 50 protein (sugar transporter)